MAPFYSDEASCIKTTHKKGLQLHCEWGEEGMWLEDMTVNVTDFCFQVL